MKIICDFSVFYLDETLPKGSIVVECGNALLKKGYKLKIFNTINFSKSMHYNPMSYIHSEKDILKLVTALMTNTKGEGQGGDPFWDKAERLLLVSLIAYLHYEAPAEEQNFATLLEMLNTIRRVCGKAFCLQHEPSRVYPASHNRGSHTPHHNRFPRQ